MMLNKTCKFCPRCSKVKPVTEFGRNATAYDGLQGYCRDCCREAYLHIKEEVYTGLHKRPYPKDARCEICYAELSNYGYHHWDGNNLNLGVWVCYSCDYFAEGIDEMDRNPWKVDIYRGLKKEVEKVEETYIYLGPFLPPDGIYKLYSSNGEQTYKWCSHCGKMKPVTEFYKNRTSFDGLVIRCRECSKASQIRYGSKVFRGLHKRPRPNSCELCSSGINLAYHHWDNDNRSKGIWVCNENKCHNLAEAIDLIDDGSLLPEKYSKLKQRIVELEAEKTLSLK